MKTPVRNAFIFTSAGLFFLSGCQPAASPFLSNLKATKESPMYTTYAAAMERSAFILDEGYTFEYYHPKKGISFSTDTGGDLGMGWKKEGRWVYRLEDHFREPVITLSYPDMVSCFFYPFEAFRVEATFLVYSSTAAVWDVRLTNESPENQDVEWLPFLKNEYRTFGRLERSDSKDALFFQHEEYPDNWTLSQQVPYTDSIRNVFLISEPADETYAFNSIEGESPVVAFEPGWGKRPVFQVNGRAKMSEGARIMEQIPLSRIQVYWKDDPSRMITENSPVWGASQGAIDQDGFFRLELGHLGNISNDREFSFTFFNETLQAAHHYTKKAEDAGTASSRRIDVFLQSYDLPPVPRQFDLAPESGGTSALLTWAPVEGPYTVNLYQRNYPDGVYTLVAEKLEQSSYRVSSLDPNRLYGFILTATHPATGEMGMHSREVVTLSKVAFTDWVSGNISESWLKDHVRTTGFRKKLTLAPEESRTFRLVRKVASAKEPLAGIEQESRDLLQIRMEDFRQANEALFSGIPDPAVGDVDLQMLYWSAFNMMRQVFYPAEGRCGYNWYVFSREPVWGWGHGGQVFHESLTMMAYALLDPVSALNSQRVYCERQHENGYINYRTGAYLDEKIEYEEQLTSSAPWYAWTNWELYRMTGDKAFLEEMYPSSKRFYEFYTAQRDTDQDGLCEWGGHAVLESVRDALVAVWDEVGWPTHFEALDLNCMLVREAKSLEAMALELGKEEEAARWRKDHQQRSELIRQTFWDDTTGFFYHVDKTDHDFSFQAPDDLKRMEIIGFLPLWAGVASPEQAERLMVHLTDSSRFWRPFGIPSLSADDPYYNDKGYWNGPVWVEWNFLIQRGLLDYGYRQQAKDLASRVAEGMIRQLKDNHNLWEFYSPDESWAGYHKTYIWAGIINRMLLDGFGEQNH